MGDRDCQAVAYLPASLLRLAATHPQRQVPWCDEVEGTLVMADLSGFTAMSERLAKLGDEGAERLTDTINAFFARMLGTASRYGGDTLTFGGDAILVLFQGDAHAHRAVAAALGMLKQVARTAAVDAGAEKIKVGMSVGAHSGSILLAAVGVPQERVHLMVLGPGAETTALAEAAADRGQVAVSAATLALLGDCARAERQGDYWRISRFGWKAPSSEDPTPLSVRQATLGRLEPFLPPYARSTSGGAVKGMVVSPEHRRAVMAFVNILGLNEIIESHGVPAAIEHLQAYAHRLTELAAQHKGFVVSSDIATKGSKLIVTFGTPVAHEHAPANAARFALELDAWLHGSGLALQHKIGLNGGHVFAGEVGPAFRRQYTVMGDAVNLAARLMAAAASGEPLINRALLQYVDPSLCVRELPPIMVKGKEEPVAICVLAHQRPDKTSGSAEGRSGLHTRRHNGRLFGRRSELEQIAQAWGSAGSGNGQAILIEGEPGIGKTRLLEEALRALETKRVVRAACFEHLQAAPFTPWIEVLQEILKLSPTTAVDERSGLVLAYLERRLPDMVELGPLLNPLLVLSLPQNDVVRSLEGGLRRQRLFELIGRMVADTALESAAVAVVEDVHWSDDSSLALLRHIVRHLPESRLLLLLTARPSNAVLDIAAEGATTVALGELSKDQSLAMVSEALGLDGLPPELGDAIHHKTKGNPLFLEEVVHSLRDHGILERLLQASSVERQEALRGLEIPDRVQGLLMSRIDGLSVEAREVLKAGSVVGRSFDARLLAGIDDGSLRQMRLSPALDELVDSDLVIPDETLQPGASVTFRHALVQDVAYESLPFARRRLLHGRIGRYLEESVGSTDHGVLVHHFRHADDAEKTRFHAIRASESSVAVLANREAVDFLDVALATARGRRPQDACLRSRLEELKGDRLEAIARYDEAIACFSTSRRRWASPLTRRASEHALRDLSPIEDADGREALLCWKIAVSAERGRSALKRALRWLDTAEGRLPGQSTAIRARILITRGLVLARLGRYREAAEVGRAGVELAQAEVDVSLEAYGRNMLGITFMTQGLMQDALTCNSRALELYEQAGDLFGQASSHGNIAADYTAIGDLRSASTHFEASLSLHTRIGNVYGVALQHVNTGGALMQMGELREATNHLEEAVRLGRDPGVNRLHAGFAHLLLARTALWSGDLVQAEGSLAEAFRIIESVDAQAYLLDAGVVACELCLAQGQLKKAEAMCRKLVSKARSMSSELSEAEGLEMLGRVLLARGVQDQAASALEASVALARKGGSDYERARSLAVLAEAEHACGADDASCAAKLDEAVEAFETMGARYDLAKALELRERLGLAALSSASPPAPSASSPAPSACSPAP